MSRLRGTPSATPARSRRRAALAAVACVAAVLALPAGAGCALIVGVNDAAALDPSQVGWFYPTLGSEGLQLSTLTLRWDDTAPTAVPDEPQVTLAIAAARAQGVAVELDLYPLHSQVFTGASQCAPASGPEGCGNTTELQTFAAWTAEVARTFPTVHEFVVMNECNQPLFVNPQWDSSGANQSAEICGRALVGAYDALKAVSSDNFVWGVGLSPRGNDNPSAASDSSTSPVAFLQDLGAWFKAFAAATGRTTPLMDGLDFHPYPIPQSQPFAQGYQDVKDASVSNLPRIYQAFYDGFNGSPQPTIGQQAGGGLPVSLNEVGIQTAEAGVPGYTGSEVSANPAGGVIGAFATQSYQSSWYVEMLELVACDPNVRLVNIYHLIDEADLAGWQSGLYDINREPKQAALAVHDWIASTGGDCQGPLQPWTPPGVAAAAPPPPPAVVKESGARILVASGGRVRIFAAATHVLRRVLAPFGLAYTGPISLALGANRGASELAVAEGPGGSPLVKLLDGETGRAIASLMPFPASFRGGVSVAFGDLGGTGADDLIVGSGPGMPGQVKVYSPAAPGPVEELTPFGTSLESGVSVAAGDLDGGATGDLIVGTGPGVPARVAVYAGDTGSVLESLTPFGASFEGGVSVAAGDLAGDGRADLIVGSGAGSTTVLRAYRGAGTTRLWSIDAFALTFSGGLSLATVSLGPAGGDDVVVGAGAGGGAQVKVIGGQSAALVETFLGATGSAAIAVAAG